MTAPEFRILSQIALACLFMLVFGLTIYTRQRQRQELEFKTLLQAPPYPYRLGWAELLAALMLCGFLAAAGFAGKYLEMQKPATDVPSAPAPVPLNALLSFFFIQGMQIGVVWAWFKLRGTTMTEVFGLRKYSLLYSLRMAALMILSAGITAMAALVLFGMWLQHIGWQVQEQDAVAMLRSAPTLLMRIVLVLGACVGAPLVEEIIFRGFLYGSLRNLTNKWFAAIFSALVFGVIHMHLPSLPALCMLGFFFALAYEVTGSLLVSILMHSLFNSIQASQMLFTHE